MTDPIHKRIDPVKEVGVPESKLNGVTRGAARRFQTGIVIAVGVLSACRPQGHSPARGADQHAAPGDTMTAERVLVGVAWAHAASPDGRFLYRFLGGDGEALVELDLQTRSERVVAEWPPSAGRGVGTPAVSHDGQSIARLWQLPGGDVDILRLTRLDDGTTETIQTDAVGNPNDWMPDGSALIIQRDGLRVLDLTTGQSRQIAPRDLMDALASAKVSPDGEWVVWEDDWTIRIAHASGGAVRSLIESGHSAGPVWSPDGRYLLYANDQSGSLDLWAVRVTGGAAQGPPVRLLSDVGAVRSLVATPSGDLLQVRLGNRSEVLTVGFDPSTLALTGEPRSIAGWPSRGGSWSPDGSLLAYVTRKPIQGDPPDGGPWRAALRRLPDGEDQILDLGDSYGRFYPQTPKWSPDGRRVVFADPDRGLYMRDVITDEGSWIFRVDRAEHEGFHAIGWMPDGERVIYAHSTGGSGLWPTSEHDLSILTHHVESGDEQVVWTGRGSFDPGKSRLSSGRDRITLLENFDTEDRRAFALSVLDLESGALQEVYRSSGRHDEITAWGGHDWLPGDRHLVTVRYQIDPGEEWTRAPQTNEFWAVPLDRGAPVRMGGVVLEPGDEAFGARRLVVHPTESLIAFTGGGSIKETWLVEGILDLLPPG
jgi:Tol biopolymer transport system component